MFLNIVNPVAILVTLSTAASVFLHDMRIDKMAMTALALPTTLTNETSNKLISFGGDLHTHTERTSITGSVQDLKTQTPTTQPRLSEDKKHLLQKQVMRGHHPFDSYNLPIV
jgi:hypothetical protein